MTMDAAQWERAQALFHAAAELPEGERPPFLRGACNGDDALLHDVLAMLEEDARGSSLLDRGVAAAAQSLLDAEPHTLPRTNFGPYRLTRVLGEGGMGVVYLARRDDLGSEAAIKILRDAWLSPARRERFASEQRTLAQLHHPSIAQLHDANTLPDGTPWFVMEYVDGVPLTEYCRAHGTSLSNRLRLFRAVCEAVQHAHSHAVIHRDLKPSNILVARDGAIKLLDFGIAKQLESLEMPADQTQTGLQLMTPAYAAPEQFLGGQLGTHTDVYALGVILYELLTGRMPFDLSERTPSEVATTVTGHTPDRPSVAARATRGSSRVIPGTAALSLVSWTDLDVLCLTAMHKDPARRYRTVYALMRDVDHYLSGEPLEARRDTVRYRASKFVRRNARTVAATALVCAGVVGLVAFYTVRLARARNTAVAEAARTGRIQTFMMNLFEGGDETAGPADTLHVVTLVQRGLREARSLDGEPAAQAELYETLGSIYQKLGNLPLADTLLRAALAQRRSLYGSGHPDVAESLVALGMLRDAQANYDDAERLVGEGLDLEKRQPLPDRAAVARATAALGQILEDRGAYDRAIPVLENAVALQSSSASLTADLSASMTELANSHFYAGHLAVSDSLNRRVLTIDRGLYGEHHPNVANDLINLGAIQFEFGHFAEAERFYREATGIIAGFYGPNHQETASALTMLGRALLSEGRDAEADSMLVRALAIQERVYGPVHPRVASTLNELGKIAEHRGRLDEAEADFARMADIYKTVYHDRHYLIGIALSNLAGVYQQRGELARAEKVFRDVIRRYGEVLEPDHQLVGIARIRLGRVLLAERRVAEAERETRAGYAILSTKSPPPAVWLENARKDLAQEARGSP
jgi:serine/threonine-protein kinase